MGILGLANAANSLDKLLSSDKAGFAPAWLDKGQNGTFSTVVGSATSFIVGTGRTTNIYSTDIKTVTNLAEMARFLFNTNEPGLGGKLFGFLTNKGGGDTAYVFGNKKSLNYRFTPNFTVDRFCNNVGWMGYGEPSRTVENISFTPKNNDRKYMVLPALFSTGLLAFDLVLAYKLKLTSYTPVKIGSGAPTGGYKAMSGAKTVSTSDLKTVALVLAGMKAFEAIFLLVLRIMEKKFFCAITTANQEVAKCKEAVRIAKTALTIATEAFNDAVKAQLQGVVPGIEATMNAAKSALNTTEQSLDDALSNFKSAWGTAGLEA
ncbi:MAG: hypothetical protein NTV55_16925 [Planctomycetota bacterium]|nr:hypothetical protein [Planctomycetota bacterium]